MESQEHRFGDGASYDYMMGIWSRSVGEVFLDWLRQPSGLHWIDVGCGSGAFTSLVVERAEPASILGIDPAPAQLDFARAREIGPSARFEPGDAMALPAGDRTFDVAVAALVMHFMPEPATGLAEMVRVTKSGGLVAAYVWDLRGGGFPYEAVHSQMRLLGSPVPEPPHPEAGSANALLQLWSDAGLESIAQREISVTRSFADFDHFWQTAMASPRIAAALGRLSDDLVAELKEAVRFSLRAQPDGSIVPSAVANAIQGRCPK